MNCPSCSQSIEEGLKFCAGCGNNLESFWAEFDQPDALVQYREELTDYLGDQELEEWEEEELEMRRGELKVTVAAHDALVQEMGGTADDPIPVSILIDTAQIGKFHVGGSSVFSFQFENQTERAIRSVELSFRDTEFSVEEVFSVKTKPIRPGGSTQGQVVATLGQSGAHQLSGEVTVVRTGSDPDQFEFEPITYDVGRDSDTPTNITVDMSNLRVADFEGAQISGSTGTQSGVVSDRSWLPLKLIRISAGAKQEEALLGQLTNLEAIENPAQRFTALCELAQTNPESRVIASALQAAADLFIVVEDTDSVQYWDEFKSLLELVHNANAVALTTKTIEVVAGWAGIAMMWDIGQIAQEDPIEIQPKLGVAAAVIRRLGASGDNPAVGGVAVAEDNLLGSEYSVWMLSGMAKAWGNSELAERARAALTSLDDECLDELDYDDSGEVVAGQGHPNLEFFKYFMERELNEPDFTADALGAKPKQLGPLDPVGENWFDSHEISLELASLVAPDKARGIAMQFAAAGSHKNAYRMNYRAAVDGEDLEALESVGNSLLLGRGVDQDVEDGIATLVAAAERGHHRVYETLGDVYLFGRGRNAGELGDGDQFEPEAIEPIDARKGLAYLQRGAAEFEVPECQYLLGQVLTNPSMQKDIPGWDPALINEQEAARWFHEAALQDENLSIATMAKHELLYPYVNDSGWEDGPPVPLSTEERILWCKDIIEAEASGVVTWRGAGALTPSAEDWLKEWSITEFDQPDALVQYREALTDFLADRELEDWEEEELERLRGELKVTVAAHHALVQEMGGTTQAPAPVAIDEAAAQDKPKTDSIIAADKDVGAIVLTVLKRFSGSDNFYVGGEIPDKKLKNALKSYGEPDGGPSLRKAVLNNQETVQGLLDCTVMGSAKNGIMFGSESGIFSKAYLEKAVKFIPYSTLSEIAIEEIALDPDNDQIVCIGHHTLSVSVSLLKATEFKALLENLKQALE